MNQRKNYEIPCQLLPVTEFDASKGIPPEQLAKIPVGGFVRDEVLLDAFEFDCSQQASAAMSDLDFLFELHDASSRLLVTPPQPAGAVRTRGQPLLEVFTSGAVWMVLGAAVREVAPKIVGYFAANVLERPRHRQGGAYS